MRQRERQIDLRSLARTHTESAIRSLALIATQGESEMARVVAANSLLDRGWGKAAQPITGEDGEGGIEIVIRHIVEGRDAPRVIDQPPSNVLSLVRDGQREDEQT